MALSKVTDNRLSLARRFGTVVTPVKKSTVKPPKRRVTVDKRKSPKLGSNIDDGKSLTPLIHAQTGKPLFIYDANTPLRPVKTPHRVSKKANSSSKTIEELVDQYEKRLAVMEKVADAYPVVPTPKKNPNAIEFAFKCSENKWAATNFSIAKFDLSDGGKIIEDPIIHCERDCVCQDRLCHCGDPEWLTTRLYCNGTFRQDAHHGDPDKESSYRKNGKNIISLSPCGASKCTVCEGEEIYWNQDDVEVYHWDF
jgi:hypothetical protein